MAPNYLNQALNSRAPSSLQYSQRRTNGFGNFRPPRQSIFGDINEGEIANQHHLQTITPYKETPDTPAPPLQGNVHPIQPPVEADPVEADPATMAPSRELTKLKSENKKLMDENAKHLRYLAERDKMIKSLRKQIKAKKAKGGRKNHRKDDIKEDVESAVQLFTKEVLYRNIKFAQPGDELEAATKLVWHGIKDKNKLEEGSDPLDEAEFVDIYAPTVSARLSKSRQYSAVRGGKACYALLSKGKNLPTLEQIEDVWEIPDYPGNAPEQPGEEEDDDVKADYETQKAEYDQRMDEYHKKVDCLVWYLDKYLPGVVGLDFWGTQQRVNNLMTDKEFVKEDPSNVKKVLVTSSSEAFAVLLYKNCREKWINVHEWKRTHKESEDVPKWDKDDPDTHKYHAIWSNSRTGSSEGGGWSLEGLEYYEAKAMEIREWRAAEHAAGKPVLKFAKQLMRQENGGDSGNRKRGGAPDQPLEETAPPKKVVKLTFLDE